MSDTLPSFSNSILCRLLKTSLRTKEKGASFRPSPLVLEDILNSMISNNFCYTDKRMMLSAIDCFLDLWENLLPSLESFSAAEKKVSYSIIKEIMRRPEFHPEYFELPTKSGLGNLLSSVFASGGHASSSSTHSIPPNAAIVRYKTLLVRTQSLVFQMMRQPLHAPEVVSFCACVTAMCCLRIFGPTDTENFLFGLSEPFACQHEHEPTKKPAESEIQKLVSDVGNSNISVEQQRESVEEEGEHPPQHDRDHDPLSGLLVTEDCSSTNLEEEKNSNFPTSVPNSKTETFFKTPEKREHFEVLFESGGELAKNESAESGKQGNDDKSETLSGENEAEAEAEIFSVVTTDSAAASAAADRRPKAAGPKRVRGRLDLRAGEEMLRETTSLYRQNLTSEVQSALISQLYVHHTLLCNIHIGSEEKSVLQEMRDCSSWLDLIKQRTDFFSVFLLEYSAQTRTTVWPPPLPGDEEDSTATAFKRFPWSVLPGYTSLLRRFVAHGLSYSSPLHFPVEWEVVSIGLLRNEELLCTWTKLAFEKTKVFEIESVMRTLDLVDEWFKALEAQRTFVPQSFDLDFFVKGIRALFDTELFQIIIRTLILLYNVISLFRGSHRTALLSDFLMRECFYRFFLHWSPDVRMVFQRILVYKVIRVKKEESQQQLPAKRPQTQKMSKSGSTMKKMDAITENLDDFHDSSSGDGDAAARRHSEQRSTQVRRSSDASPLTATTTQQQQQRKQGDRRFSLDSALKSISSGIKPSEIEGDTCAASEDHVPTNSAGEKRKSAKHLFGFIWKGKSETGETDGHVSNETATPVPTENITSESAASPHELESDEHADSIMKSTLDAFVRSLEHPGSFDPAVEGIEQPEYLDHLRVYSARAIREYHVLLKEYESWKTYVLSPQCPAIQFPVLSIPQFEVSSD